MVEKDVVDKLADEWTRDRPDLDSMAMAAATRVMLIGKYLERAEDATLSRYGVSLWQFDVLATLRGVGPPFTLKPSEIMQTVMLSSGGMTNRLDRMEADGYVKRRSSPDDRRSIQVVLTPKGKRIVDKALGARFEVARDALAPFAKADIKRLNDLLRTLVGRASTRPWR